MEVEVRKATKTKNAMHKKCCGITELQKNKRQITILDNMTGKCKS